METSMYKYFIIVLLISASLTQRLDNKKHQNLKPNSIDLWEKENKKIKNPELKKELKKLNEEFQNKRENIKNNFKEKIKPLKLKKDNDISNLKSEYLNKRKLLFEKYGIKRNQKLKENKKPPYHKRYTPEGGGE